MDLKEEANHSYRQILKSTGIFGGSQIIVSLLGIIRNKILTILLGASGIGLISIYQSILDMIRSLSTFGIETTGVTEIASSKDENKLQESVSLIERWSLLFAVFSFVVCLLVSYPVSVWVFNRSSYTIAISLLSICLFFTILSVGQIIILHGLRRITDMVKATLMGNFFGLLLSLPFYYFFRKSGIVPAFILASVGVYLSASYYRRQVNIATIPISIKSAFFKLHRILKLGSFIVFSAIITMLGYFLIRVFVKHELGLAYVGFFQATWTITNVYIMLVLKSMGSDFFPRLCSIIDNKKATIQLINEQTYIVLLVILPLIVGLLLSAELILSLLYSSDFTVAISILHWFVLGTFFKVLSWPLGFVLLAKGKGFLYFVSEMIFLLVYLFVSFLGFLFWSFEAIGIAYLIAYVIYLGLVYVLGHILTDFKWSSVNIGIGIIGLFFVVFVFLVVQYATAYSSVVGVPILCLSLFISLYLLNRVFSLKSFFSSFRNK